MSLVAKQFHWTHMLTFGITPTFACFPYSEQKTLTWLNKTKTTTSLVEKTLRLNLCLKSRIIPKNIAGSPDFFTKQPTIHFKWLDSVNVSIWTAEEILAARGMMQLKSFKTNNQNWHYANKNKLTTIYLKAWRQKCQNYFKTIKIDIIRIKIN